MSLKQENDRLRAEVESLRQQEIERLTEENSQLRKERDHYRDEAHRNAKLGHDIALEAEQERQELLQTINQLRTASLMPTNERVTSGIRRSPRN